MKKLKLTHTTIRHLAPRQLAHVQGGGSHNSCLNVTCTCPPTYPCGTQLTQGPCV